VTLPLAGRGILAGSVLAWARSVSEFGSIVILTYNPKVASIFIFDRFTAFGLPAAVPAAVILLLVALAVFLLVRVLQPEEPT
jgi:molybdate/tungstate transport system permease protein